MGGEGGVIIVCIFGKEQWPLCSLRCGVCVVLEGDNRKIGCGGEWEGGRGGFRLIPLHLSLHCEIYCRMPKASFTALHSYPGGIPTLHNLIMNWALRRKEWDIGGRGEVGGAPWLWSSIWPVCLQDWEGPHRVSCPVSLV